MSTLLSSHLQGKSSSEIINALGTYRYESVRQNMREDLQQASDIFRTILLIIDFDTEVHMNGVLGFLENSTGRYLSETIEAFRSISAQKTVSILENITQIMTAFDVTPHILHADVQQATEFAITSFVELHGSDSAAMGEHIENEAQQLYLYHEEGEPIGELLEAYVEAIKDELVEHVRTYETMLL